MIGEREVASGFHSFWSELFPLLTPSCVSLINTSYGQYIRGFRPVDVELRINAGELKDQDLLAEGAFEVFRVANANGSGTSDVFESLELFDTAWETAVTKIGRYRPIEVRPAPARNELSFRYVQALCMRYEGFRAQKPDYPVEISPVLKGCGILGVCEADISIGPELVEVKAISRNFTSKDIRQIVLYLALDAISGANRWDSAVLFNPRRAWYLTFDPRKLLEYISAGKSAIEVYRSIEDLLLRRDFVRDQEF